jgi:hypothetical protein
MAESICGIVCAAGRKGEPLACGHKKGHRGKHAWASLPTFVNGVAVEDVERAARVLETLDVNPPEARGHFVNAAGVLRMLLHDGRLGRVALRNKQHSEEN